MKFGQLIPTKITKVVTTGCQNFGPKCTKFDFAWRSAQDPAGELSALPRGCTSMGIGKEEEGMGKGEEGGSNWKGGERNGAGK